MHGRRRESFTVAQINIYIYASGQALVKYEKDFHRLEVLINYFDISICNICTT